MNPMIKKGLYIKKPWTDLILSGQKIWEIRGSHTHIRERIFIIESKTSLVVGECTIIDSIALSSEQFLNTVSKHCVNQDVKEIKYKKLHAWVLSEVLKYEIPIPHIHKMGTVIWVNF
jgi:hypothetical protein